MDKRITIDDLIMIFKVFDILTVNRPQTVQEMLILIDYTKDKEVVLANLKKIVRIVDYTALLDCLNDPTNNELFVSYRDNLITIKENKAICEAPQKLPFITIKMGNGQDIKVEWWKVDEMRTLRQILGEEDNEIDLSVLPDTEFGALKTMTKTDFNQLSVAFDQLINENFNYFNSLTSENKKALLGVASMVHARGLLHSIDQIQIISDYINFLKKKKKYHSRFEPLLLGPEFLQKDVNNKQIEEPKKQIAPISILEKLKRLFGLK